MKKIISLFKSRDTLFNRLLLSFVLIVVVVVTVVGLILTEQFMYKYDAQVESLEYNRLHNIELELHNVIRDADSVMGEIATNVTQDENVNHVLNKNARNDYYKISQTMSFFQLMAKQDDYVSDIEFYSKKSGLWLSTTDGVSYTTDSPEMIMAEKNATPDGVLYHDNRRWITRRTIGKNRQVYSFISGYPLYALSEDKYLGLLISDVEVNVVDKLLKDNLSGEYDSVAILGSNGRVIFGVDVRGEMELFLKTNGDMVSGLIANEAKEESIKNDEYTFLSRRVDYADWTIVKLLSRDEMYSETEGIRMTCFLISLGVAVIGIVLAAFFAKRMYKPVDALFGKLNVGKLSKKRRENEYYYIDRAIDELKKKAEAGASLLQRNIAGIRQSMAIRFLSGRVGDAGEVKELYLQAGFEEVYPYFVILLIRIPQKAINALSKSERNFIYSSIMRFIDEYEDSSAHIISADMQNGNVCAFVNVNDRKEDVMDILRRKLNDYVMLEFIMQPILLESDFIEEFTDIEKAYNTMIKATEYIYYLPQTHFFDMREVERVFDNKMDVAEPNYDLFTEALVSRDIDAVKSILKRFIESPDIMRNSVSYLNGILLKYIFLYNYYLRDIMKEQKGNDRVGMYEQFNAMYDIEDFYHWFIGIIKKTFDELTDMEQNPKNTAIKLINDVIDASLRDENLSLEYIAEKVYLNPKYVSRIYREETGIKITQYISDRRLEMAAELLINTNISLEELIGRVGFSSVNYFVKKFKEKYYVTPVQYRRNSVNK